MISTITIQHYASHLEEEADWYSNPVSMRATQMVAATMSRALSSNNRDRRLKVLSRLVGRQLSSTKSLTASEAIAVLHYAYEDPDEDAGWHQKAIDPKFVALVTVL